MSKKKRNKKQRIPNYIRQAAGIEPQQAAVISMVAEEFPPRVISATAEPASALEGEPERNSGGSEDTLGMTDEGLTTSNTKENSSEDMLGRPLAKALPNEPDFTLPSDGVARSRALYDTTEELIMLARGCALRGYCYAADKKRMCALRDRVERLRQNDSPFDGMASRVVMDVVSQMKGINFWMDPSFTMYRMIDRIEAHQRELAAAAAEMFIQ